MKNLDVFVEKLNFKKIAIIFIILAAATGIASAVTLGSVFYDKLTFAYNYSQINKKFETSVTKPASLTNDLTNLSKKSNDIVDILILNDNNEIIYSSNNTNLAWGKSFNLQKENGTNCLVSNSNRNVAFRLITGDKLMLSSVFCDNDAEIKDEHDNDSFYENNFSNKTIYTLSYSANKNLGERIFFISNVTPVERGSAALKLVAAAAMMFFMVYWVLIALWVYKDSFKTKLFAPLWGIVTLITNLAGLLVYEIYKHNNTTCSLCGASQSKNNLFCTNCGNKISNTCQYCGAPISKYDSYCSQCGNKIKKTVC
jgi:hypothetical protein